MKTELNFAGLKFIGLSKRQILNSDEKFKHIVTVNAEYIVNAQKDEKLKNIICSNYSTFDGQIPYVLAKLITGRRDFEKISGSDFIYDACEYAKNNSKKVFLLGGKLSSNQRSVKTLREKYEIEIEGYSPDYKPYPFDKSHNERILNCIKQAKSDILFVGFGAIKQDYWIEDNMDNLKNIGIEFAIGSGGTFEFVSEEIKRAPFFIQKIGLEGIYRFLKEPKLFRLKRLAVSFKIFKYVFR